MHCVTQYPYSIYLKHKNINIIPEMDVPADRILRDLWVLKYHPETIYERLLRVKNMGIDNLCPWMVRCSEDILNRYESKSRY